MYLCVLFAKHSGVHDIVSRYSAMSKGSGYVHHHGEDKLGGGGKYWQTAPSTHLAPLNGTIMGQEQQA